jgi:hypothetical protein
MHDVCLIPRYNCERAARPFAPRREHNEDVMPEPRLRYVLRRDQCLVAKGANACDEPGKRAAIALRVVQRDEFLSEYETDIAADEPSFV